MELLIILAVLGLVAWLAATRLVGRRTCPGCGRAVVVGRTHCPFCAARYAEVHRRSPGRQHTSLPASRGGLSAGTAMQEKVMEEPVMAPVAAPSPSEQEAALLSQHDGPLPQGALARLGKGRIKGIAVSPQGDCLAVGTNLGAHLFRIDTLQAAGFHQTDTAVESVAFSPADSTQALGLSDGTVILWDTRSGRVLHKLHPDRDRITPVAGENAVASLAFSPDGTILASSDGHGGVTLWRVKTGRQLQTLNPNLLRERTTDPFDDVIVDPDLFHLAFSPTGTILAESYVCDVILWDVRRGKPLRTLTGDPFHLAGGLAFSPDGTIVACLLSPLRVYVHESAVVLWDVETGHPVHSLRAQGRCLAFSPDGATLAAGMHDGSVILWNVATGFSTVRW